MSNSKDQKVNNESGILVTENRKGIDRRIWKDRRMFNDSDYSDVEKRSGKGRRLEDDRRA